MSEIFGVLTTSDFIQLISVITAIGVGITSIVISVKVLKQNSMIIRESNRAYLSVYSTIANFQDLNYYLVLKNFGQSGAKLKTLKASVDLATISLDSKYPPFFKTDNTYIAPGQSIVCPTDREKIIKLKETTIEFELCYVSNGFEYKDSFSVNIHAFDGSASLRASTKNQELKIISYTLQDIAERQL